MTTLLLAVVRSEVLTPTSAQLKQLPVRDNNARGHGRVVSQISRLRGGALSREEIVEKLNRVPTFAIVNGDDVVLPISTASGGKDICWFTDAAEAKELLEVTRAANPEADVQLAVTPLCA